MELKGNCARRSKSNSFTPVASDLVCIAAVQTWLTEKKKLYFGMPIESLKTGAEFCRIITL